ncbi:MAG: DUF4349 domain-containing protein [Roseburia sp.]|nr:DUF4349 domain-containing protein [Roseburia sp.]
MRNKFRLTAITLVCAVALTGCSGGGGSYSSVDTVAATADYDSGSGFYNGVESYSMKSYDDSFGGYAEDAEYSYDESDYESGYEIEEPTAEEQNAINKDMLIYRGDVEISTKSFDDDLKAVKEALDSFDTFFEYENLWTDYSYYSDDDRNLYHWDATVRVDSSQYEQLLNGLNEIGTVTRLSSSCENVSAEYTDTIVAIDIYEAERERYVNMLSTIMDDQYALEVQRELTDIELKLAQFRARKQNIETDVSYSYVDISLTEVRQYEQQSEYNDNFFTRLWNTIANTFFGFCSFLEWVLFALIRLTPFVLFFILVYVILKKIGLWQKVKSLRLIKSWREQRKEKAAKKRERRELVRSLNNPYQNDNKDNPVVEVENIIARDRSLQHDSNENSVAMDKGERL